MKVNTHGLKMIGLRKVAGESKSTKGYYDGYYIQLNYNISTGELLTSEHWSLGQNSWSKYNDRDIIFICNISNPMTMQEIADTIARVVAIHKGGRVY
jgi:hypothetical protein